MKRTPLKRKSWLRRKTPLKKKWGGISTTKSGYVAKRRRKKGPIQRLKDKCWAAFSIYIRMKHADPHTGLVKCVTCGVWKHWKEMQAGHFVPSRSNSILFDERGVYPQCYSCNVCRHGNTHEYIEFMKRTVGPEKAEEIRLDLIHLSKQTKSFTAEELEALRVYYGNNSK